MGLHDDSLQLSSFLKRTAPQDKQLLMSLLAEGRALPNLIIAELLVEIGLQSNERDEVATYILDIFTDQRISPDDPTFARATVVLARLKPSSKLAASVLVEVLMRKEARGIHHYFSGVWPVISRSTRSTDYPRVHAYAAYVLSKLGPYGPESVAYVPKLLTVLRRTPSVETEHLSFLPVGHNLNLHGLDELEVLVDPVSRRAKSLTEIHRIALTFAPVGVAAVDVEDAVSEANFVLTSDDGFRCNDFIADTLVCIGPFAIAELMTALDDPELSSASAEIISRIKPTPPEFVAKMLQWLDGEDERHICDAVMALNATDTVEAKWMVRRGTLKLKAILQSGRTLFSVSDVSLVEAIGRLEDPDWACRYTACTIRENQVNPSVSLGYHFRLLARLGRPALPTIQQFTRDDNWKIRFLAHMTLLSIGERSRAAAPQGPARTLRAFGKIGNCALAFNALYRHRCISHRKARG